MISLYREKDPQRIHDPDRTVAFELIATAQEGVVRRPNGEVVGRFTYDPNAGHGVPNLTVQIGRGIPFSASVRANIDHSGADVFYEGYSFIEVHRGGIIGWNMPDYQVPVGKGDGDPIEVAAAALVLKDDFAAVAGMKYDG